MMKTLTGKILVLSTALCGSTLVLTSAQTTTDKDTRKEEAELEKQKRELEKKSIDLQRKELHLEKAKQELQYQTGKSMSMNLAGDVLFDYNKAALKPAAEEALQKVAVVLSLFPESNVTVEGYPDSKSGKAINLELSRERATSVKNWLVKNGGAVPTHISAKGFGEENPGSHRTQIQMAAITSLGGPKTVVSPSSWITRHIANAVTRPFHVAFRRAACRFGHRSETCVGRGHDPPKPRKSPAWLT